MPPKKPSLTITDLDLNPDLHPPDSWDEDSTYTFNLLLRMDAALRYLTKPLEPLTERTSYKSVPPELEGDLVNHAAYEVMITNACRRATMAISNLAGATLCITELLENMMGAQNIVDEAGEGTDG